MPGVLRSYIFKPRLTAADEMNDLDPVAVGDADRFPVFFPHDFPIKLDRDTFGRKLEFFQKLAQIHSIFDFPRLAVDYNAHLYFTDV